MELSDENLRTLSEYLQKTLNPQINIRRPAEKFLESVEVNKNYPILLLHLINKQEIDITIRISGAVAFKNFIKRNWSQDDDGGGAGAGDRIHDDDRQLIKASILDMMLMAPESIQRQLSDAIAIIGKHDFPDKWTNLLDDMVAKFASGDFHIINGILRTAHSIFKRYRYEFKSQALWSEIKFVLDKFAKPLTELFQATIQLTVSHANNAEALKVIYNSLLIICKIFYSLNFQDLPEFFEDNMKTWMVHFRNLLTADVKCLQTGDDEEPGLLEQLRSQVCWNVSMYAQKYDEEFAAFLPDFVTDIWTLLITTGKQHKYDLLVSNALQFLATVADRSQYRHLFEQPDVLSSICEKVVIPNMEFRPSDEELFEDNAEEYIRRDMEGSDVDTRRRAACDLVKVLSKYFEQKMLAIFGQYVQAMLQQYAADESCWRQKDAALYLVTSLANKGQTQKHGITQATSLVNLPDFTSQHVLPELQKPDVNRLPVMKADALKYMMQFRSVLPPEVVVATLPHCVRHLAADSQVVHTYAACLVEKALLLQRTDPDGSGSGPVVTQAVLAPLAADLLNGLFATLERTSHENEYVMKAIMRCFSVLQETVMPLLSELLPKLTAMLRGVARNPSRPHFNHYLFETLTLAARIVCRQRPDAVASFEQALFPIFELILQQDVQEFTPYVFQMLSLLLDLQGQGQTGAQSSAGVPQVYVALYPCLLSPLLWERPGNVRPLVRLLLSFVRNASSAQIDSVFPLSGLLGVFQKLIASRANDHEGFYLMQCLIEQCPRESLDTYMRQIFILLFQRLTSSKTTKYVKGLLVFLLFYCTYYGPSHLIAQIDNIQAQMFRMVVERLLIPDVQKISGAVEVKIAAVGLTRLLCDAPELIDGIYAQYWGQLLRALIGLFEQPEDDSLHPDDHYVQVEDTPGYEAAFSQLAYAASRGQHDPLKGVSDARLNLAQSLAKLSAMYPGRLNAMLENGLEPTDRSHLHKYLLAANVQLA